MIEARNLRALNSTGVCNPFVKITVANAPPQVSHQILQSNSATWNQSFTFPNILLNDAELKKFEILIEVLDMSDFKFNGLIG